jgi:hypothetical protein
MVQFSGRNVDPERSYVKAEREELRTITTYYIFASRGVPPKGLFI